MANLKVDVTSEQNFTMTRGDTFAFGLLICGNTEDLDTAYFSVKEDIDGSEYVFQKSLGDGISKVETGEDSITYRVRVAPEDTLNLDAGEYYYDFEIGINGDVFTIYKGILDVQKDVTRRGQ